MLPATMLKWWGLLMTNTRMLVLFLLLFIGQPVYYFWFELIPLNVLFVYLIVRQEKMAESLEQLVVVRAFHLASPIRVEHRSFRGDLAPGARCVHQISVANLSRMIRHGCRR